MTKLDKHIALLAAAAAAATPHFVHGRERRFNKKDLLSVCPFVTDWLSNNNNNSNSIQKLHLPISLHCMMILIWDGHTNVQTYLNACISKMMKHFEIIICPTPVKYFGWYLFVVFVLFLFVGQMWIQLKFIEPQTRCQQLSKLL